MRFILLLIFSTFCLILDGCKEPSYKKEKAYVYQVNTCHFGRGYFKIRVHYRYNFNGKTYENSFMHNLGRIYYKRAFEEGDSIIIKVQENRPRKSGFIRISYDKDYMKGLRKVN